VEVGQNRLHDGTSHTLTLTLNPNHNANPNLQAFPPCLGASPSTMLELWRDQPLSVVKCTIFLWPPFSLMQLYGQD